MFCLDINPVCEPIRTEFICATGYIAILSGYRKKTKEIALQPLWSYPHLSLWPPFSFVVQTQCQQELDQILERISKMPFRDNRGPLEDLYALHIPNCDKRGQYNLKQVDLIEFDPPGWQHAQIVTKLIVFLHLFSSARCLCMARGGSAGASALTPAGPSRRPPPWGETPTAASTWGSWSCMTPPRYNHKIKKQQNIKKVEKMVSWQQRNCKVRGKQRTSD